MTTIKDAINDLFNAPQFTTEEAVDRHFGPVFRQRVNGTWDDRSGFLARMDRLRETVAHAAITVLDEFSDGGRYAERHVIDMLKRDGERILQEVYVLAERGSDGRFIRIEETALTLEVR
ncbi:nuclear transport factor 2 family protein [Bordetella hinzii]|nr:nuclear transport factor 2 family protein [Bordetella hinzii]